MKPFQGIDFLQLDDLLSEDEKLTRDTVRKFVEREVMPEIGDWYLKGVFPKELIPRFADLGLLGSNLKGYGCAGVNSVTYGLALQELERGDSGLRSFVSVQGALCMYPIYTFGSDEQKKKFLPEMAKGKLIGCFGLTEPDYGSNPSGMTTTAKKDGNQYVLSGNKMWITSGSIADLAIVWAKLNGEIRGFIVEAGRAGFKTTEMKNKFSLRASVTSELHFQDCRIPAENLLPKTEGLKSPLMCLNQARYGIAWGSVGAAMASLCEAIEYSKERVQFDRPIAAFQLTQKKLVEMLTDVTNGQLIALRVGRLKDEDKAKHYHISYAKRHNVAMALKTARTARSILGANGISSDYHSMRHACNLESVYTYEGTDEIHTLIIGKELTGISAFE
ncbi:MAG: acyl-CoA dehydrogenase [Deltaproteobacteria bacterium RIFCSPHIGHO2_12_FULL_43_9]|nr:MAG: acyl-CoA dehydrogenase [Deltaproteobacteria bacterium RIFCSPHIGHO2_12_FULL_43_9]